MTKHAMRENRKPDKPERKVWEITRRTFLKSSGVLLAGAALGQTACAGSRFWSLRPGRNVRFGLVADLHYADVPSRGSRHYRQVLGKLEECLDLMNREKVDFLVELGDFKDQDEPPVEAKTLAYLKTVEEKFQQFKGPRYHVLGNHDLDSISKKQFLSLATNPDVASDRGYYSFDLRGIHFTVLDANFRSDGAEYDRGNFDWTDANVPDFELDWLERDLAEARGPAVVFTHQLLDGAGNVYVENAPDVRRVLEESGKVLAVFQGHHHAGDYKRIKGIHYYTLKATVEGPKPEDNAYVVVEVLPDGILVVAAYRKALDMALAPLEG